MRCNGSAFEMNALYEKPPMSIHPLNALDPDEDGYPPA
jgi:hypothetical protein